MLTAAYSLSLELPLWASSPPRPMWFWFLNHTLLSLLALRKSTASALIIAFSETFWFVPRVQRAMWMWFVWRSRLPFTHKHTPMVIWSQMINLNWGLAHCSREPSGRIFPISEWYRHKQPLPHMRSLLSLLDATLVSLHVDRVYIHLKQFDSSAQWLVHTHHIM